MANFLSDLQKKYSDILNPINQGLSSYAHGVQQRFNTPSKIAPPLPQSNPIRSFINPIVNEAKNVVTQQIPSFQRIQSLTNPLANPPRFFNEANNQVSNFTKKGLAGGVKDLGMDVYNSAKLGANVYGGSKILAGGLLSAAKTILPNAVIGGGFNKLTGGSFSEGAGRGVAISPSIRGITGITNPLIEKYTQLLAPRIAPQLTNSAVGNYLTTSTLRGLQNIPEGAVIDATLGNRPMGTTSMMLDFASGFIPGSPNIRNQSSVYNVDVVKPWQKAFRAASDQAVAERINIAIKNLDDEFQSATNVIPKKYVDVINEASSFFLPKEAQKLPLKEKMDVWRYIFARSAGMYTDKVPEVLRGVDEMYNPKTLLNNSMGIVDKKNVAQQGGEILYHGTSTNRANTISKEGFSINSQQEKSSLGKGIYFSADKGYANTFGKEVVTASPDPNLKIFDASNLDEFFKYVKQGDSPEAITKKFQAMGYDGIKRDLETVIFDPKKVHVAQQPLSDIGKAIDTTKKGIVQAGNTYADLHGVSPDSTITVYRGVKSSYYKPLAGGEWVTQDKQLANLYARNRARTGGESAKIISQKVKASDLVIDPSTNPGVENEFRYNPSSPQQPTANLSQTKKYTQLGSATNTRADQIAGKFRNVNNFEAEMDAQIGKTFEKPFSGKSRVKAKQPVDLPGDQATTDFATGRMAMGGNGIKGLPKDTSDQFQLWVNRRRATDIEGFLKKKEFKDLDNKGVNGIFEFQAGNKSGRFGDVKRYFDAKYKTLQDNKIEFDYRQDYLPQLWNNSQDEINQVFGRRLGMKPSFTLEALFKSYEEGINAGLKPKFSNISDLVGWYEQKANKALADKRFFDYLGHDGQILPSSKAPQEWVTLDPDRFPKFLSQIGDEQFAGTYKAPKELADVINNYLQGARFPFLEKVAGYVSKVKNITLNFGIPGTGINMHGVNILARHTLMGTGGNPISRFITGGKFMLAPNLAAKELDKSMINAPQAVKNGLSLSAEDYSGLMKQGEGFRAQFGRKWEAMFGDPLFNKMIPALKLSSYENLVKNGMNEKDAAKLINNVYGGINWEQMGRSKDMQNLIRIAILAPDWAESTLKIGGNFAKALNPLEKSATVGRYRTMMATVFASYIAHNIVNKITSGHYSYENDPSNIFNIEIGYTDSGEKRYFRPYGTGLDMVRLPAEVAMGLYKGDLTGITRLLRNRLSIPAGVGLGLLTDQDYRGNAIGYRGTDKYGNEMPLSQRAGNITSEMASLVGVPAFTRQLYRGVSGQQGLEESLTQGLELPFRYSNTGNSNVQKQVDFIADEQGLKGKDRYDFNQQLKGQSKFSDNQLNVIKSYDNKSQGLKDTLQLRKVRSEVEKAKKGALKESGIDQADAAEETPITTNSNMQLEIAKSRVKMTKKTERVGDNIVYPTETGSSTLSLTPPTKGSGIGAYANKDWNITKAREVWNNDQLSKEDKDYAFKKLGVNAEDVRYDALANYSNDIKSQYLSSKSDTKEKLINNILTGRKRSIGDNIFASDGVIDSLVDEGKLTKEEGKALKAIDYNKDGSRKIKVGSGRGKKIKIPKVKAITIKFNKSKRIKVKQIKPKKVKQYKLSKVTKVKKLKV